MKSLRTSQVPCSLDEGFADRCRTGLGALNGSAGNACDARCRFKCGNGIKDSGEECDNGVNDGSYGTCKHDCSAPNTAGTA